MAGEPARIEKSRRVVVEGNIGAGKSTLINHFQSSFPSLVEARVESVDAWTTIGGTNVLANFYENPERWGLLMQLLAMYGAASREFEPPTRIAQLSERSIFATRYVFIENLHAARVLSDAEYETLQAVFELLVKRHNYGRDVDLIVYLQTDPCIAHDRICMRNRPEERGISREYIQQLHWLYESWLVERRHHVPAPVLVLDANCEPDEMIRVFEKSADYIFGLKSTLGS